DKLLQRAKRGERPQQRLVQHRYLFARKLSADSRALQAAALRMRRELRLPAGRPLRAERDPRHAASLQASEALLLILPQGASVRFGGERGEEEAQQIGLSQQRLIGYPVQVGGHALSGLSRARLLLRRLALRMLQNPQEV